MHTTESPRALRCAHRSRSVTDAIQLELPLDFTGRPSATNPADLEMWVRGNVVRRVGARLHALDLTQAYLAACHDGARPLLDLVATIACRSSRVVAREFGRPAFPSRRPGAMEWVRKSWPGLALLAASSPATPSAGDWRGGSEVEGCAERSSPAPRRWQVPPYREAAR